MPKKLNYTLSEIEHSRIEQAIKSHSDLRVRERARIIRLLHKEVPPAEVAELLAISPGQVYYWHKRWREEGMLGLTDKVRSGRPRISDEQLREKVVELLETDPQEMGYAFTVWNVSRLLTYFREELQVKMHENTLRNCLKEMGYVFRRPKHDLTNLQDADAKARAESILDDLKKKPKPKKSNFSLWTKPP